MTKSRVSHYGGSRNRGPRLERRITIDSKKKIAGLTCLIQKIAALSSAVQERQRRSPTYDHRASRDEDGKRIKKLVATVCCIICALYLDEVQFVNNIQV